MENRNYHHGQLKQALLDAGHEILVYNGIESLSLRNVARRAGVSHSAPYRHFKNMEDFIVEMAVQGFHILVSEVEIKWNEFSNDNENCIIETGKAYFGFAAKNPEYYRIMFGNLIRNKTGNKKFFTAYHRAYSMFKGLISEINPSISTEKGEPDITALSVWSFLHGYASLVIDNESDRHVGSPEQVKAILKKIIYIVFTGPNKL